jgi:hypothetical protein
MKIFVCTSRHLYKKAQSVVESLEKAGHVITLPNNYDNPGRENKIKKEKASEFPKWKSKMFELQAEKVSKNDAILVLNFEKNGQKNYIGGATFLEMFKAWELGKKIFLYNPIPDNILKDEIVGLNPTVLNEDLNKISSNTD